MTIKIGIDLGTVNSCVAYIDELGRPMMCPNTEGTSTTPSAVAVDASGRVLVGDEAVQMRMHGGLPTAANFKRSMGDPAFLWEAHGSSYSPEQLSGLVLRKLVDDVEACLGQRPREAVVTVPAYFRDPERLATRRAIEMAGLEEIQIVNEPTAAAIAYGAGDNEKRGNVLVYDLGGGTFDVTVLDMDHDRVLGSSGDYHLGGVDWDERLASFLSQRFEEEHGWRPLDDPETLAHLTPALEEAKKRLSVANSARLSIDTRGQRSTYVIDRTTFDQITSDLLAATLSLMDQLLDELGLTDSQIDEIVLVGGSTRMPVVTDALEARFHKAPRRSINPDEAVALGAAILAESRAQESIQPTRGQPDARKSPDDSEPTGLQFRSIQDVTNHQLGMIAVNEDKSAYINTPILARHQPVPCEAQRTFQFTFRQDPQHALEVFVTQGELFDPFSVTYIGRYAISSLPGVEVGEPSTIDIAYHYDESGVVSVRARKNGQPEWIAVEQQPLPDDVPDRFAEPPSAHQTREHLTVVIIIDVSGSMRGEPLEDSKAAARRFVAETDLSNSSIGIGVVSDGSGILRMPSQNADEIDRAIEDISCGLLGTGNSAHPFDDIYKLMKRTDGVRAGIVLADGIWQQQSKAINMARRCHEAEIHIVGIGFGSADEEFIKAISSTSDLGVLTSQAGLGKAFSSVAQILGEKTGIRA